jgi:KDO2-lipid IV(A) lauroyltransferase
VTYPIGHVGAWLAYRLMPGGTNALVENFHGMFPDRSEHELRQLALRTYRSYARDATDFMRSLSMTPEATGRLFSRLEPQGLEEALSLGKGAISVSAHFGNWELGGVLVRRLTPYALCVVVLRETSAEVGRMRHEFRASLGIETIEVRQRLDTALKIRGLLQQNRVVAMLVDRYLDKDAVQVTFFGRPTFFLRTPALMAYFTGAPLVPSFVYREEDGRFAAECGPVIHVPRTGDRDDNVQRATQAVATLIEDHIRRRPHCWYQFYRFWPSQDQLLRDADRQRPAAGH